MDITPELRDLLVRLGIIPRNDSAGITITEQITLEKFEDDVLVERIEIDDDGTVTNHWSKHATK